MIVWHSTIRKRCVTNAGLGPMITVTRREVMETLVVFALACAIYWFGLL